ncbi:MAG TPA: glycerol-3-phosphate dehydrogenase/oxidase [Gemmatimonadales bacterium]|nr:glycerol-3-phosphate dehydrogenase/oxidase [Gemmatimonadales bacterium]
MNQADGCSLFPDRPVDPSFSHATRVADLATMGREAVDLLVVGGGATGTGIARDAAMRGMRTALIDKGDFGSGTSGRSSRLVHGGLRYLELGDWRLVFEASRERRTLLRIAPHLVWPRSFIFPVHAGGRVPTWKLAAGLWLYDLLAVFRNVRRHRMLGKRQLQRAEPALRREGLRAGARYFDAQCDDCRLALANARDARRHGGLVANYVRADRFAVSEGRVRGVHAVDQIAGGTLTIRALVVVNATGPWADGLRAQVGEPPALRLTKGAHVAVPRERLGNHEAVTITSPIDGRVMFVLPWGEWTYIGTTDTDSTESPDDVRASAGDVVYLLRSANAYFPDARLGPDDVKTTWAGLRCLVDGKAEGAPSGVLREHRIIEGASGLISVVGGKLTTYRSMAAEAVDRVGRRLAAIDGRAVPPRAPTDREPLPGGEVRDLDLLIRELEREEVPRPVAQRLVRTYGSEATAVARLARSDRLLRAPIVDGHPSMRAELVHAIRREMAMTLSDLLVRRTHVFYETEHHALPEAPELVELAASELNWSAARKAQELADYLTEVERSVAFRAELKGG